MTRVDCHHHIAFCLVEPVGKNEVHCKLGGDVRGEATLAYDPIVIQKWIYDNTGLSCFNFQTAFQALMKEMKEFVKEELGELKYKSDFQYKLNDAAKERSFWEERSHEEASIRLRFTQNDEEEVEQRTYVYSGRKW